MGELEALYADVPKEVNDWLDEAKDELGPDVKKRFLIERAIRFYASHGVMNDKKLRMISKHEDINEDDVPNL